MKPKWFTVENEIEQLSNEALLELWRNVKYIDDLGMARGIDWYWFSRAVLMQCVTRGLM